MKKRPTFSTRKEDRMTNKPFYDIVGNVTTIAISHSGNIIIATAGEGGYVSNIHTPKDARKIAKELLRVCDEVEGKEKEKEKATLPARIRVNDNTVDVADVIVRYNSFIDSIVIVEGCPKTMYISVETSRRLRKALKSAEKAVKDGTE